MIEVEQNYKIILSEVPHCPGLSDEEAARVGATNIRQTYIYLMVEYTTYIFSVRARLNECIMRESCGKVLASGTLDEVEQESGFQFDENYDPINFPPDEIRSQVNDF